MLFQNSFKSALRALCAAVGSAMIAGATPAAAQAAPAGCTGPASPTGTWIDVAVEGVRSGKGLIAITLYADNSRKFLARHGSLYVGRVNAVSGTTTGCIQVPRPGVYAIAIYHDEDGDQKFNRTGLGLPDEGFGFSNNPSTLAGLPAFKSVRLSIPRAGLVTRVRMRYP